MSVLELTRSSDQRDSTDAPIPVLPSVPEQRILAVEFSSPDGRHWKATGGGTTVAAAIIDARESCPDDATWHPTR